MLRAKGDYVGAELLCGRALAICEKVLGPNHPQTRTVRKNYEELRRQLGAADSRKAPK